MKKKVHARIEECKKRRSMMPGLEPPSRAHSGFSHAFLFRLRYNLEKNSPKKNPKIQKSKKKKSTINIKCTVYRGGVLEIVGVVPPLWLLGGREWF